MGKSSLDLTIVIISRNEEEMIGESIKSAITAANYAVKKHIIKSYEILHVDSASTDRTVDIAKKYPIRIIQLKPDWPKSAAAGLYTGYKNARGKYFMPLGGDMILKRNWLVKALPYLKEEKNIGGITGFEEEHLEGSGYIQSEIQETLDKTLGTGEVEQVGIAIFPMTVLKEVGGYNPYLKGGEDKDISYRIVSNGYKLIRIPDTSIVHYWSKKRGEIDFINVLRSSLIWSIGDGQSCRYALYNQSFVKKQKQAYFRARQISTYLFVLSLVSLIGLNLSMIAAGNVYKLSITIIDFICIVTFIVYLKKHNWDKKYIYGTLFNIPYYFVRNIGFIKGYMIKPKSIESYPEDILVIEK